MFFLRSIKDHFAKGHVFIMMILSCSPNNRQTSQQQDTSSTLFEIIFFKDNHWMCNNYATIIWNGTSPGGGNRSSSDHPSVSVLLHIIAVPLLPSLTIHTSLALHKYTPKYLASYRPNSNYSERIQRGVWLRPEYNQKVEIFPANFTENSSLFQLHLHTTSVQVLAGATRWRLLWHIAIFETHQKYLRIKCLMGGSFLSLHGDNSLMVKEMTGITIRL